MYELTKALGNYRTTIIGALSGVLLWWQGLGWKIPASEQEWVAFIGGAGLILLGAVAKDGNTGSDPGAQY